jgi:hypothetical protein
MKNQIQVLVIAAVALAPRHLTSAQTTVPLIAVSTNQVTVAKSLSKTSVDDGELVYADPGQITYPMLQPATIILGPSGPDIQVNDLSQNNIQTLTNWKWPFEDATDSETTVAADGSNIVVSYNGHHELIVKYAGNANKGPYYFAYRYWSSYSVSHDGGQTWRSSIMTPPPGSIATGGDGVLATDRAGNFYYASLGNAGGNLAVIVGKSTDHGDTFDTAQVVALDPGRDKPWIAVGPDPNTPSRDNIYVTWDSDSSTGTTLAFSMSIDGGATWSPTRTLFAYTDDGVLSSTVTMSNPTVDKSNGRLYVPFAHFNHIGGSTPLDGGPDFVRMLVSDDGGGTFYPLAFNVPGAPNPYVYPFVPAGTLADCGQQGGTRNVVKQGPDIGGGLWTELFGLPRYVQCTRLIEQPATVAQNGRVVIVEATSTNPTVQGDPASGSQIMALYSKDAGSTWSQPFIVTPATASDPRHFHPALALAPDGTTLYIAYYVQQSNEKIRTELASLRITGNGLQLLSRRALSSVAFDMPPCNIPSPLPPLKTEDSINFDQTAVSGYALGEYMGVTTDARGNPMAAWGDGRNTWVSPANGLYPGPHPKSDVFFVRLSGQ